VDASEDLRQIIADLRRALADRDATIAALQTALATLEATVRALRAQVEASAVPNPPEPPESGPPSAAELAVRLRAAEAEIAQLRRAAKRPATPFAKGTRKDQPKKPGRKRGKGRWAFRQLPEPPASAPTEPPLEVPVAETRCACGGDLEADGVEIVSVTEVLPPPPPQVRRFAVQRCRCRRCGATVRGRHPEVAPDQAGASAHRWGPQLLAEAHLLYYGVGIPQRRVPAVLWLLRGVEIPQATLNRDALRRAAPAGAVGQAYAGLRASVRTASRVNTDDTGWKMGGEPAYLMAFSTPEAEVYQIRERHRNEEVRELIPEDYGGVMGCDGGPSYEARELAAVQQQKCNGHLLRNIADLLPRLQGEGSTFALRLKALLQEAIALWHAHREGRCADFAAERQRVVAALTEHLRERPLGDPAAEALLNRVGYLHDHGHLVRYLENPEVEPTNNVAERALRGAVIARKVSQCSKNPTGAQAYSAFVSVIRTLKKRGVTNLTGVLATLFRTGALPEPT
jgi:transposase